MLTPGIRGAQEELVTLEKTAETMGSGLLPVYATPAMIALIEKTAWTSVEPYLGEGQGTVGTNLAIRHVSATPVGLMVECTTVLREIDGRRLVFDVTVTDAAGIIGEGVHERFIVDSRRFLNRAEKKREEKRQAL